MKSLLALLALGLLGTGFIACGGSKSATSSAAPAASAASAGRSSSAAASAASAARSSPAAASRPPGTTSRAVAGPQPASSGRPHLPSRHDREKYDRDDDDYTSVPDDNNPSPPGYVAAGPADAHAITSLVKRYYAAALRGDGARGCSMMYASFVKAVPLDYGRLGPAYLRRAAGTCPAVMSLLFRHEHRKLAREVPQMRIVRVSVGNTQGAAFMRFGRLYERFISVQREGSAWRIGAVLDGELE